MDSNLSPAQEPVKIADEVSRSKGVLKFFDGKVINNTTAQNSRSFVCEGFRKFTLYLNIKSTGTPTTLRIRVQFLNPEDGQWYTLKQGIFASFYYEDGDVANGVKHLYNGECAGREMRISLTGAGTTSSAYFTVSAGVEFYN